MIYTIIGANGVEAENVELCIHDQMKDHCPIEGCEHYHATIDP